MVSRDVYIIDDCLQNARRGTGAPHARCLAHLTARRYSLIREIRRVQETIVSNEKRSATPISALPLLVGGAAYYLFLRPQMKKWGTRLGESQRRLPGDDIIPKPNLEMTHAIDIDAPPEAVWPWLNQMGRERSGYYGLDSLLNQGIPSVNFLRKDIPGPVRVEMSLDKGFHVMALEEKPGISVRRIQPPAAPWRHVRRHEPLSAGAPARRQHAPARAASCLHVRHVGSGIQPCQRPVLRVHLAAVETLKQYAEHGPSEVQPSTDRRNFRRV